VPASEQNGAGVVRGYLTWYVNLSGRAVASGGENGCQLVHLTGDRSRTLGPAPG